MKIAFDVDDCLLLPSVASGFDRDTPNYAVIAVYRWFSEQGHHMIIWSGSGVDYARTWAEKLGLVASEFPMKQKRSDIDIAFDDCNVDLARVNIRVHRLNNHISRKDLKAFDLFIGRQRTRIKEPSRLAVDQEIETYFYYDMPHTVVVAQSYKLFVGEKLFASVRIPAKRRYSRSPITVTKPKRGPLQIHFIKKYVTLH